ncbi:MAG: hypothetical protein ACIAS6_13415 [Phycisphaerales bacterium JB060]
MKRKGSTTSIVIATIAGLSVLGVAGYRMMSGDCSSCAITGVEATAATTVATQSTGDSCCPLTDGQKQIEATPVATEAAGESCSGEKACGMETACSDKAAQVEMVSTTGESCEVACSEKAACEGDAAQVELVSTTTEASDCGSACAGDACGKDADACCGKCEAGKELAKAPQ